MSTYFVGGGNKTIDLKVKSPNSNCNGISS
jgi:hypothetical protein